MSDEPDKWRWIILFSYSALAFANGTAQVTFSPFLSLAEKYFGVNEVNILW
jgi:hypothetical protein